MDQDRTPESRELLSEFEGSGRFHHRRAAGRRTRRCRGCSTAGKVDGVVRVLPGFARDVERGRATSVQVLLDGTNSNTASHGLRLRRPNDRALFERGHGRSDSAPKHGGGHHERRTAPVHAAVPQVDGAHAASGSIPICTAAIISFPAWW